MCIFKIIYKIKRKRINLLHYFEIEPSTLLYLMIVFGRIQVFTN